MRKESRRIKCRMQRRRENSSDSSDRLGYANTGSSLSLSLKVCHAQYLRRRLSITRPRRRRLKEFEISRDDAALEKNPLRTMTGRYLDRRSAVISAKAPACAQPSFSLVPFSRAVSSLLACIVSTGQREPPNVESENISVIQGLVRKKNYGQSNAIFTP